MPTAPECGQRLCRIGSAKVLWQPQTKEQAETDRHVSVPRKIEVELRAVTKSSGQCGDRIQGILPCVNRIHTSGQRVGNQHLFREAQRQQCQTQPNTAWPAPQALKLWQQPAAMHDRSSDQLGKETQENSEIECLGLNRAPSGQVHLKSNGLKKIERDAQRQTGDEHGPLPTLAQPRPVFEKGQQREVNRDNRRQRPASSFACDKRCCDIIDSDDPEQNPKIGQMPLGIKPARADQQPHQQCSRTVR